MYFLKPTLVALAILTISSSYCFCLASESESDYERFLSLCVEGNWSYALTIINRLLQKNKSDPDYLVGRARIYIGVKKYRLAILDCSRALKYNPQNFSALRRRSYCYLVLKQYEAGIKDLSYCIDHGFGSDLELAFPFKDYFNRSKAYGLLNQPLKAKSDLKKAILCTQLKKAIDYRKTNQLKLGIATATNVIEKSPGFILAYPVRGLLELNLGKNKQAVYDFSKYISKYPNVCQMRYYRADALMELGKYQDAIADLNAILKLNPKLAAFDRTAYTGRGREHFQYVDTNRVNMADITYLRGICYLNLNQFKSAKSDFSKVIKMDPKEWEAFFQRGKIWYHLKQDKLAIEDFSKSLHLKPDYCKALVKRASAYERVGQIESSVADYQKALSLCSKNKKVISDQLKRVKSKLNSK